MDLIDRQAAIEHLRNNVAYMRAFGCDRAITLIREVPSAQPELIRCKECKYFETAGNLLDGLCRRHRIPTTMYLTGFCSMAERRTDAAD